MAIDSQGRWGPAVAAAVQGFAGGLSTTEFITNAQLEDLWKLITGEHQEEINDHADIMLQTADVSVLPGTFKDSTNTLITGIGINDAVTLTQKIK